MKDILAVQSEINDIQEQMEGAAVPDRLPGTMQLLIVRVILEFHTRIFGDAAKEG